MHYYTQRQFGAFDESNKEDYTLEYAVQMGPKLCIPTLTINHFKGGSRGEKVAQEVNLRISSLTIRVTESGVGVGVECSWSDSIDNTQQIMMPKRLFE